MDKIIIKMKSLNKLIKTVNSDFKGLKKEDGQRVILGVSNPLFQIVGDIKAAFRLKCLMMNNVRAKKIIKKEILKNMTINIGGKWICQT